MPEPIRVVSGAGGGWELFLEGSEDDKPIATVTGSFVPRRGDEIFHEDYDKPLRVTRVVWAIRRDYPVTMDVYAEVTV
jgi:hypothetical protein